MTEVAQKILAYQQGPIVFLVEDGGVVPEQFLQTISSDEKRYVRSRCHSGLRECVEQVLSDVHAACISPNVTSLLVDSLRDPIQIHDTIDSVFFPLAADPSTQQWLREEHGNGFRSELRGLLKKTTQRFGQAQLVVISMLPHFADGQRINDDFVCFGEQVLDRAAQSPMYATNLFDPKILSEFCDRWSWIGVHPKFFTSDSLQEEVVSALSDLSVVLVAQQ